MISTPFPPRSQELEENEDHLRKSLRRMPCLRQVSEVPALFDGAVNCDDPNEVKIYIYNMRYTYLDICIYVYTHM